jgi:non-specific serine/threonine protein kinase
MAVTPKFALTVNNASAIAQICRRLDGIPLAIELAAARVKVLTPEQIESRLNDRFRLLTSGRRMALPHQHTLQATMDWSYDLLGPHERTVFRRLSVFAGGFGLEAMEAVCSDDKIDKTDVLNLLAHLVDKSLVVVEESPAQPRYHLLETVRQYSLEKLLESGEEARLRKRHRDRYLVLAERAEPELHGPGQLKWLEQLEQEHDNLRAAMEWSLAVGEEDEALRLAGAMWWFWHVRGHFTAGREWSERALARGRSGADDGWSPLWVPWLARGYASNQVRGHPQGAPLHPTPILPLQVRRSRSKTY